MENPWIIIIIMERFDSVLPRVSRFETSVKTSSPSLLALTSAAIFTGPLLAQVSPAAPGSEKKSPGGGPVWPWFGGFPMGNPLVMTNIAIENDHL